MYEMIKLSTFLVLIFAVNIKCENPNYDQGMYKPDFLNYCFEEDTGCLPVCTCMLDKKCMVRPIPRVVMELILERHNSYRKEKLKADPKPSGMSKLEYDHQLQSIAECWAAKCRDAPTKCLLTEVYSDVGVNVGMIKIEDMDTSFMTNSPYSDTKPLEELWKSIIDTWYKEIESADFTQEFIATEKPEFIRGAQMLHDQTLSVGCAWSASPEGSFFYCMYGPAITNGSFIYKYGSGPCSTCPPGLRCEQNSEGLCVKYSLYPAFRITRPPPVEVSTDKQPPFPPRKGNAQAIKIIKGLTLINLLIALLI